MSLFSLSALVELFSACLCLCVMCRELDFSGVIKKSTLTPPFPMQAKIEMIALYHFISLELLYSIYIPSVLIILQIFTAVKLSFVDVWI